MVQVLWNLKVISIILIIRSTLTFIKVQNVYKHGICNLVSSFINRSCAYWEHLAGGCLIVTFSKVTRTRDRRIIRVKIPMRHKTFCSASLGWTRHSKFPRHFHVSFDSPFWTTINGQTKIHYTTSWEIYWISSVTKWLNPSVGAYSVSTMVQLIAVSS